MMGSLCGERSEMSPLSLFLILTTSDLLYSTFMLRSQTHESRNTGSVRRVPAPGEREKGRVTLKKLLRRVMGRSWWMGGKKMKTSQKEWVHLRKSFNSILLIKFWHHLTVFYSLRFSHFELLCEDLNLSVNLAGWCTYLLRGLLHALYSKT